MLHSVQRFLQECQANSNFDIGETHKWTSASWTYLFTSVALVLFAGMCSGLTLGLLSLDLMELEVLKRSGSAKEQAYAERIIPLIKNTHYLLVTLLLSNAAAMEALPIFLDRLVDPLTAILVSVTAGALRVLHMHASAPSMHKHSCLHIKAASPCLPSTAG